MSWLNIKAECGRRKEDNIITRMAVASSVRLVDFLSEVINDVVVIKIVIVVESPMILELEIVFRLHDQT